MKISRVADIMRKFHNHPFNVGKLLMKINNEIMKRIIYHDHSKYSENELKEHIDADEDYERRGRPKFGTDERKDYDKANPVIASHRKKERHHPEYHENGIEDMNLVDLMEMLCDWCERTPNSIERLENTFEENCYNHKISSQVRRILENTVKDFELHDSVKENELVDDDL